MPFSHAEKIFTDLLVVRSSAMKPMFSANSDAIKGEREGNTFRSGYTFWSRLTLVYKKNKGSQIKGETGGNLSSFSPGALACEEIFHRYSE